MPLPGVTPGIDIADALPNEPVGIGPDDPRASDGRDGTDGSDEALKPTPPAPTAAVEPRRERILDFSASVAPLCWSSDTTAAIFAGSAIRLAVPRKAK